jgi:hypothetical protein
VPTGGDRRQAERSGDRKLWLASLLFAALDEDNSPAGRLYSAERLQLFKRYRLLLRCLVAYPVPGEVSLGPAVLQRAEEYLINSSLPRDHLYPRPVPLREEVRALAAERDRREAACCAAYAARRAEIGHRYFTDPVVQAELHRLSEAHVIYVGEPFDTAIRARYRTRRSRHQWPRRYLADVRAFCERWKLNAWWAVPSIIDSHFTRMRLLVESNGKVEFDQTLGIFAGPAIELPRFPIVVQLPGTSDTDFRRARDVVANLHLRQQLDPDTPYPLVVHWHPERAAREAARRDAQDVAGRQGRSWETQLSTLTASLCPLGSGDSVYAACASRSRGRARHQVRQGPGRPYRFSRCAR